MGDESMVSGMSEAGGPPGTAAGGVGAEGIMKKLSNYWFIVGSIPLVLFLLVCLPTVFYVKSISEYKNAFYCRSKACDTLAEATKGAREAKPCDDYFGAVCSAAKTYTLAEDLKRDKKLLEDSVKAWGESPNHRGAVTAWAAKCAEKSDVSGAAPEGEAFKALNMEPSSLKENIANKSLITAVFKEAQKRGIDCLFHFEWVQSTTKRVFVDATRPTIGEGLPDEPPKPHYDLAISIPDMGIMEPNHYAVTLGGMSYEEAAKQYLQVMEEAEFGDEEFKAKAAPALKKIYEFIEYCKDLDFTAAPLIVKEDAFATTPGGQVNFAFRDLVSEFRPGYKRYLLRSPNYVKLLALAVNECISPAECFIKVDELVMFVVVDTYARLRGYSILNGAKIDENIKKLWCMRYFDWYTPTGLNVVTEKYLKEKYWPFALNNPKDPKAPLASSSVGNEYMAMLLDSFQHSYALSEASSEKSRAGLHVKILQMDYFAFYKNTSDKVDDEYLKVITPKIAGDDVTYKDVWDNRIEFYNKYWDLNNRPSTQYLIGRHPLMFGDDEGSYDYGTNVMYVPFGMFRPQYFRDSKAYMGNYATFGYYGSMNILKLLDNAGAYTKTGYQHPVLWTGTYALGKMTSMYRCLNKERANNTDARLVAKGSKPLSPGFRFFRRQALVRAYPRPEYRLDLDAKADMEQIYLTAVMRTYCRYPKLKLSVNKMFSNDLYYQKAYCSEGAGKLKKSPDKLCYIWRSTRREY